MAERWDRTHDRELSLQSVRLKPLGHLLKILILNINLIILNLKKIEY